MDTRQGPSYSLQFVIRLRSWHQPIRNRCLVGQRSGHPAFGARNDWRMIDWADYVAKLRAIPKLEKIYVWRQEDYDLTHRLILNRLLSCDLGAKFEPVDERINQGLSADAVHQTLQWMQDGKTGPLARDARAAFPIGLIHKPFGFYTSAILDTAQARYADQCAKIDAMDGVNLLHPPPAAIKAQSGTQPEG